MHVFEEADAPRCAVIRRPFSTATRFGIDPEELEQQSGASGF